MSTAVGTSAEARGGEGRPGAVGGLPAAAGPVDEARRITALDSVRGFALLGILLVNIHLFAAPFGEFILPAPPAGSSGADVAAFYFTKIFCEARFYPLFSMLFGMGLVLQMRSVERRGGRFVPLYARRLLVLMCLGAVHALGLWYGDILLVYGTVGWMLLLVRRWSARALLITAAVILVGATALNIGLSVLMVLGEQQKQQADAAVASAGEPIESDVAGAAGAAPAETVAGAGGDGDVAPVEPDASGAAAGAAPDVAPDVAQEAAPEAAGPAEVGSAEDAGAPTIVTKRPEPTTPLGRLMQGLQSREVTDPTSPGWLQAETEAYRDGGYWNAAAMRAFSYAMVVVFSIFGFGWHVLVMFLIGAALVKLEVFAPENRALRRRLAIVGLGVGMPLAVVIALLPAVLGKVAAMPVVALLAMGTSTLTALGYFGGAFLLAESGRADWLMRPLGAAGRMALTVYLSETVVATFIMYHWGLAMFGEFSRAERAGIAVGIYVPLVALSVLWMRVFRIGPMEWLWRTLTYLRPPRLLRGGDA